MNRTNRACTLILLVLTFLFISAFSFALPHLSADFCLGLGYAAYPASLGYSDLFSFAADTLTAPEKIRAAISPKMQIEEGAPDTETAKIEETQITYKKESLPDYKNVSVKNHTQYALDLSSLMQGYAPPKKNKDKPQILILHTHATEAFADCDNRTTDNQKNMVAVGNVFAESLTKRGFNVLHDTTQHDYPNYNGSYVNSLKTVEWYLKTYPSIEIIFDLHRDGIVKEDGTKVKIATDYNGQKVAQLMLVVGTNAGGLDHPNWQENLKFAAGLQSAASALCDTIMRPIDLRTERFNQHKSKCAVIVECGSNGNDIEEAKRSVQILAAAMEQYIL